MTTDAIAATYGQEVADAMRGGPTPVAPRPTPPECTPPFLRFCGEALEEGNGLAISATPAFQAWAAWCRRNGLDPGSQKRFGGMMGQRYVRDDNNNRPRYLGVRVRPEPSVGAVLDFLHEGVRLVAGARTGLAETFVAYRAWCNASDLKTLTVEGFFEEVSAAADCERFRIGITEEGGKHYLVNAQLKQSPSASGRWVRKRRMIASAIVDGRSLRATGRTEQFNFRARAGLKQRAMEAAEAAGVTLAEWMESAIAGRLAMQRFSRAKLLRTTVDLDTPFQQRLPIVERGCPK